MCESAPVLGMELRKGEETIFSQLFILSNFNPKIICFLFSLFKFYLYLSVYFIDLCLL